MDLDLKWVKYINNYLKKSGSLLIYTASFTLINSVQTTTRFEAKTKMIEFRA